MNKKVLLLVGASLSLAGCAQMGMKAAANVTCSGGGECPVTVTVTSISTPPGCAIDAPDRVTVKPNGNGTNLKWQISGDNQYQFKQSYGVAFDKSSGAPPGGVMPQNGNGQGRTVTIHDTYTANTPAGGAGSWAYSIYVTGNGVACEADPWVDNN